MPIPSDTFLYSALAVVLVCWAVGAYNRLIRLKNAVGKAYGPMDAHLRQRQELIASVLELDALDAEVRAELGRTLRVVRIATDQARQQPSGGAQARALQQAEQRLDAQLALLWGSPLTQRAVMTDPLLQQVMWDLIHMENRLDVTAEPYNEAVAAFNAAAQEFPAWLIARLAALKPLPGLHLGLHGEARQAARPLMMSRRNGDMSAPGPGA